MRNLKESILQKKLIVVFATLLFINLSSQNLDIAFPHVTPMSPDAAELAKYTDYPVSYYTGTPNISLPIYEINIDGLKIPINLNYHASGIRADQEATWVGLGWSLDVGGKVSRTVNGTEDFLNGIVDSSYPSVLQGYYEAPEQNNITETHYNPPFSMGILGLSQPDDYRQIYDSEPDIFYYSLPGGISGKFVLDKSRGAILSDKSHNLKVEVIINDGYNPQAPLQHRNVKFKITDSAGNQYFYNTWEVTKTYTSNGSLNENALNAFVFDNQLINGKVHWSRLNDGYEGMGPPIISSAGSPLMITSWCLSKIVTKSGREINFEYEIEQQVLPVQESAERYTYLLNDWNGTYGYRSKSEITAQRLKRISGDFGQVSFNSSSRSDIKGDPQKLDEILIKNSAGNTIKTFKFEYDYFNDNYNGNPLYTNVFKRLKLNKFTEYISPSTPLNNGYVFDYYPGEFPAKNSKNVDYWGFQNGKNYGKNFFIGLNLTDYNKYISGVRKDMNFDKAIIGTLKKITYPTGSSTEFIFEAHKIPHHFFSTNTHSLDDYIVEVIEVYNENSSIPHPIDFPWPSKTVYSFSLEKDTEVRINCSIEDQGGGFPDPDYIYNSAGGNPLGTLRKVSPTSQSIYSIGCPAPNDTQNWPPYDWNGQGSERTLKEKTFTLSAGNYEFEAYTPPKNLMTGWRLSIENNLTYSPTGIMDGGGIRIKEIRDEAKIRKYNYDTGTMIIEPVLYYFKQNRNLPFTITVPYGGDTITFIPKFLTQSSDFKAPLSSLSNGAIVGYNYVEEFLEDSNSNISKTSYSYNCQPESVFDEEYPDSPIIPNYTNGLPISIKKYDNNKLVEQNDFFYDKGGYYTANGNFIRAFKDKGPADDMYTFFYITRRYISYYSRLIGWPLKSEEIKTVFTDDGKSIVTETYYDYNTRNLPIETKIKFPSGEEKKATTKYAHEKSNQSLIDANMIGIPLETMVTKKSDSLDTGKMISKIETVYSDQNTYPPTQGSLPFPSKTRSYDIQNSSSTTDEITYDQYDSKGNLLQYTTKSDVPTAIIWGYNQTQPIAKIEGATYAQVSGLAAAIISASNDDANDAVAGNPKEQDLLIALDAFRTNSALSGYQITTYSYDPLIGVRSITPPSGIRETYTYDDANRLQSVKNSNGEILKEYQYHYKP